MALLKVEKKFSFLYSSSDSKVTALSGLTTQLHTLYITPDEFKEKIISNIPTKNRFLWERNRLALMLGHGAGIRTEELVIKGNLDIGKLRKLLPKRNLNEVQAIYLSILGKNNKVRKALLSVELTRSIYDFIWGVGHDIKSSIICDIDGNPLIDENYGTKLFRSCVDSYLSKNNISNEEVELWIRRTFHILRKCYATDKVGFCYRSGLDPKVFVTQWMGHADPETTEIYIFYDAVLNKRLEILNSLDFEGIYSANISRFNCLNKGF